MTHFWEFVFNHKSCLLYIQICNSFWPSNSEIYRKNILFFYSSGEKHKPFWLLSTIHFSFSTNQAKSRMVIQLLVYVSLEIFMKERNFDNLDNKVISKKIIVEFLSDLYSKNHNVRYIPKDFIVDWCFILFSVSEFVIWI